MAANTYDVYDVTIEKGMISVKMKNTQLCFVHRVEIM